MVEITIRRGRQLQRPCTDIIERLCLLARIDVE
jgi:hypothetical protein